MDKLKNGFTLIELLAVIVILGVVSTIITISIMTSINSAKKAAYTETVHNLFAAYQDYIYDKGTTGSNPEFKANDEKLSLNADFTNGKIFTNSDGLTQVKQVTNGTYCASGTLQNLEVVQGECYKLDHTAPDKIDDITTTSTASTISVTSHAIDYESDIKNYEYFISSDGKTYDKITYCDSTLNVCLIRNLTNNTTYSIGVKVTNQNKLTATSKYISVSTSKIEDITMTLNPSGDVWAGAKTVKIKYPLLTDGTELEYSYVLNKSNPASVTPSADGTYDVNVNQNNSSITAIVKDKNNANNTKSVTLVVTKIDNEPPVITIAGNTNNIEMGTHSTYTLPAGTATDNSGENFTVKTEYIGTPFNSNAVGTYTIRYFATDNANNTGYSLLTIKIDEPAYSGWTTNNCSGQYNCQTSTEYGYQDVASWSGTWNTSPSSAYYTAKTQYGYQTRSYIDTHCPNWNSPFYYTYGAAVAHTGAAGGTDGQGGWEIMSGSCEEWKNRVHGGCNAGSNGFWWGRYCTYGHWSSWGDATGWRDGSAYGSSDTVNPMTRTVYADAASWGSETGWTMSGAYAQTTSRKPVSRTVYRYQTN